MFIRDEDLYHIAKSIVDPFSLGYDAEELTRTENRTYQLLKEYEGQIIHLFNATNPEILKQSFLRQKNYFIDAVGPVLPDFVDMITQELNLETDHDRVFKLVENRLAAGLYWLYKKKLEAKTGNYLKI